MFLLDTNVVSALMLPVVPREVASWISAQPLRDVFTTAISQAEIALGITQLPPGRRRAQLAYSARLLWEGQFEARVLQFGSPAAAVVSECAAFRLAAGRPIAVTDLLIAALGRLHNAIIVTRNTRDFEHCGVPLLNPWESAAC